MKIGIVWAAALCAASLATAAHAQEELKLGVIAVLSGPGQPWGQAMARAAEMAADDANAKGFEVGGKRYTVKVVAYDSKYRADEALAVANRLVLQDKVKFIIGPLGSAEAVATQEITNANKVVTMTNGWSPRMLGPQLPYQFRMTASTDEFAGPLIQWASQRLKLKKIGGLFPNDELGQQASKQVTSAYAKVGATTQIELFERNRVDFVPLLTRLMNQGIEAIDLDGNAPATAGLIVKQARGLGFKGPIVRSGGPAEEEILQVAGKEAAEGIYLYSPINLKDAAIQDFIARYKKKYSGEVNGFAPAFYDSTRILLDAIRRAGSVTDTDAVVKAVSDIKDFPGIQGKLNWTGKAVYGIDRQIASDFYIVQLHGGKSEPVARCNYTSCADIAK
ncbi:MAG: amino acid transporter substrate-binding protein [Rhizobacter sp.]|nr:amino acid transporter substrate-binding protein [Rhizobacter sp.]